MSKVLTGELLCMQTGLVGSCSHFTLLIWMKDGDISFQNNLKALDLSSKTDLDLWDCFGKENPTLYPIARLIYIFVLTALTLEG